jgi:hypothetical protein
MIDDAYQLRILTRCRVAGHQLRPGQRLLVPRERLQVVDFLDRTGSGRPADAATARDLALFRLLRLQSRLLEIEAA